MNRKSFVLLLLVQILTFSCNKDDDSLVQEVYNSNMKVGNIKFSINNAYLDYYGETSSGHDYDLVFLGSNNKNYMVMFFHVWTNAKGEIPSKDYVIEKDNETACHISLSQYTLNLDDGNSSVKSLDSGIVSIINHGENNYTVKFDYDSVSIDWEGVLNYGDQSTD